MGTEICTNILAPPWVNWKFFSKNFTNALEREGGGRGQMIVRLGIDRAIRVKARSVIHEVQLNIC